MQLSQRPSQVDLVSDHSGDSDDEGGAAERPPRAGEDEDIFTAGPVAHLRVADMIPALDIVIDSWLAHNIDLDALARTGCIFEGATFVSKNVSTQCPMPFLTLDCLWGGGARWCRGEVMGWCRGEVMGCTVPLIIVVVPRPRFGLSFHTMFRSPRSLSSSTWTSRARVGRPRSLSTGFAWPQAWRTRRVPQRLWGGGARSVLWPSTTVSSGVRVGMG